jgi:hypothetical protein
VDFNRGPTAPAYPDVVTGQHSETPPARSRALTLDELAQRCHATPVTDANELAADIWESDEELDAFLADLRSSRDASLS